MATDAEKVKKFKEIGVKRVPKALTAIRHVGSLANKASYEYTQKQADKIVTDLRDAVNEVDKAFKAGKVIKEQAAYTL